MSSLWATILDIRTENSWMKHRKSAALLVKILTVLALLLSIYSKGLACPDGQHEECFLGTCICVPSGGATIGTPDLIVAAGIIASHDAVIAGGGRPIPASLRKTLRRWYPDDLLNAVRWTSLRGLIKQLLQDSQMNFDDNTLAITMIDVVIFRNDDLAYDGALWAHELYHVQQYREWGVFGFAKRWVENSSVSGPIEAPAYAREAEARPFFLHP